MSDNQKQVHGQCLCGAVTIALTGPRDTVGVCHCDMCRRWSGGPFVTISGAQHEVTGEVSVYRSSGWAERAFCKVCGSNLYYHYLHGDHYAFLAGLFDDLGDVEMGTQLFIDQQPEYYSFAQDTEKLTAKQVRAKYGVDTA